MATSPEFLGFILSNIVLLFVGGALTAISYLAYRRDPTRSLFSASAGFGLITVGMLVEGVYEIGFEHPRLLTAVEILRLQILEKVVVIVGLCAVLYSLVRY